MAPISSPIAFFSDKTVRAINFERNKNTVSIFIMVLFASCDGGTEGLKNSQKNIYVAYTRIHIIHARIRRE